MNSFFCFTVRPVAGNLICQCWGICIWLKLELRYSWFLYLFWRHISLMLNVHLAQDSRVHDNSLSSLKKRKLLTWKFPSIRTSYSLKSWKYQRILEQVLVGSVLCSDSGVTVYVLTVNKMKPLSIEESSPSTHTIKNSIYKNKTIEQTENVCQSCIKKKWICRYINMNMAIY